MRLENTARFWTDWTRACRFEGPYRDAVVRSMITLEALTYEPTGALVAAATTSLPEHFGGERNWDYRYCWLRDATFTLLALLGAGNVEEARAFREWLCRQRPCVTGHVPREPCRRVGRADRRVRDLVREAMAAMAAKGAA